MVAVNILLLYEVFILSLRVLEWINLVTWSVNSFQLATIFGIVCCVTDCYTDPEQSFIDLFKLSISYNLV